MQKIFWIIIFCLSFQSTFWSFFFFFPRQGSLWLPCVSAGKESTCSAGDLGSISGLGRSLGEGNSFPLQYSGLKNSMDYIFMGWQSQTWLNDFHSLWASVVRLTKAQNIHVRWFSQPRDLFEVWLEVLLPEWSLVASACSGLKQGFGSQPEIEVGSCRERSES